MDRVNCSGIGELKLIPKIKTTCTNAATKSEISKLSLLESGWAGLNLLEFVIRARLLELQHGFDII